MKVSKELFDDNPSISKLFGDMAIKDLSPKDANSSGRIIKNMRICGSGLYEYHVSEAPYMGLTIPGDYKDEFFKIFRSPEVLNANKELYARVPIITGHHVRVNTSNAKQLAVGMVGDTVQSEVGSDGETYLYTTGTIITGDGIEAYEKYGELSVGYDPIVEWQPGTYKGKPYQAVLKGFNEINHLLICKTARGGHQCMIMDSVDYKRPNNGGKSMGMFSKIFGGNKPMTGDARVVEVLLDSIKVGADPATQVAAVRSMMGDAKDETFTGYLDELAGITGDEDKGTVAKAIDVVKDYYREHLAGDEKEIEVKKDGDKKNVEVKKDGKETKDIEVKKDGDKKEVEVKETGDADKKDEKDDKEKENGDGCHGDEIADIVAKAVAAEFARRDAEKQVKEEPKVNGDELARLSAIMSGDSKEGTTSDKLMSEIF
jgi:hypothetical protein